MNRHLSLLILAVLLPCLAMALTLSVKQDGSGDYTAIQAALDAANPGDTVLVYPGRYYENLNMQTSNISLMSLEGTTGDPSYIDSTILDGNMIYPVLIISLNMQNVYIRGFSITNGFGTGLSVWPSNISVVNCYIYRNIGSTGSGIVVSGATIFLSGVKIYDNYAMQLGGGIYASEPTGYHTNIIFDPINRCSIYNNRAGAGQDIYIQHANSNLYMPLDIFSVAEPTTYYAAYLSDNPLVNNYQINFDILNAHHQEIESDLYVSTIGNDTNDGLSPATALKTIHEAIYRIAADSLNQNTVHILPGEYSRTDNDQVFPIAMKGWVIVQGSGIDSTTVIGEPHSEIDGNIPTLIFSVIMAPDVFLSDMSITSRNITYYGIAIGGDNRFSSVEFSNLRIYNIGSSDTYDGSYEVVYLGASKHRESLWKNVTFESIEPAKVQLLKINGGIPHNGEISAMRGKFINCAFRNATSTYVSSSVWARPLVGIVCDGEVSFDNCEFSNLTMLDDNSIAVAIGSIQYPQQQNHFTFRNCLFTNNTSPGGDVGGIASITSVNNPRIDIINCTFAGNQGNAYTLKTNGEVNIVNSIFYNDTPYQIKVEPMDGDPNEHTNLTIDHALVKDGINGILPYPVPGNTIDLLPSSLNTDPFFTGGDDIHDPLYYSLSALSPCINSGTPDTLGLFLPPYDLAGNWRVWNGQIDMGCFEFGAPPVANDDPLALIPPALSLNAYPNPFSAFTTILLNTPVAGEGRPESKRKSSLCIYNIKGQKVKNLSFVASPSGEITSWDGRNEEGIACANGIYLLQLQIDGVNKGIRKVTLIK